MLKRFDLEAAKRGETVYCICFGLPVEFVSMADNGRDILIKFQNYVYTRSMNEVTMTDLSDKNTDEELTFEDQVKE